MKVKIKALKEISVADLPLFIVTELDAKAEENKEVERTEKVILLVPAN